MKRGALGLFLLISTAAVAAGAMAAIQLNTSVRTEFLLCAAGGSSAQTVVAGNYLMRITGSDATLCYASTCAAGGEIFPQGAILYIALPAGSYSCRSPAALGNITLTAAQ